ncbi:MAG: transcriptional regulator GcvA [Alphaproteobacteria bacterium]|nr:transcriptional regulator GcvA [Alphaproteobacteria bacterium]
MARSLPSLNSLRAFEAAARLGSFALAAEELHVTPAAISHQIKGLEDWLGVQLFRRQASRILVTDAARNILPEVSQAFDRLARAAAQLRAGELKGTVIVSTLTSFAVGWLVPKLADFRQRHPAIDVVLWTERRFVDFRRDEVDLALRYGRPPFEGLVAEKIMDEDIFPVCSPALLNGPHQLRDLADLAHQTLLHDIDAGPRQPWLSWSAWLDEAGVTGVDGKAGPRFSDSSVLIAASVAGQGVALGRSAILGDHLEQGRLVRPFPLSKPSPAGYYAVAPEETLARPTVHAFYDWLLEWRS